MSGKAVKLILLHAWCGHFWWAQTRGGPFYCPACGYRGVELPAILPAPEPQ